MGTAAPSPSGSGSSDELAAALEDESPRSSVLGVKPRRNILNQFMEPIRRRSDLSWRRMAAPSSALGAISR